MALIEKHAPGSFCWIELATSNQDSAKDFYRSLFNWDIVDNPMGPEGIYTLFQMNGKDVAACCGLMPQQKEQGVPPHWALYICVASADEAVEKATAAGGKILAGPFDVMEHGRMAVIMDTVGAVYCVWQPKNHIGVRYAGDDNTFCWADLSTNDVAKGAEYYKKVFGWELMKDDKDPSGYLHIKNGEEMIGGIPPSSRRNPTAPSYWHIYFLVNDVGAYTKKVTDLSGKVYMPPMAIENVGTMSVVADREGAVFSLFKLAPKA